MRRGETIFEINPQLQVAILTAKHCLTFVVISNVM